MKKLGLFFTLLIRALARNTSVTAKYALFFIIFYLFIAVPPASAQSCTVENITVGNTPAIKINYGPSFANQDLCVLIYEPTGPWERTKKVTLDDNGSFNFTTGPKLNQAGNYSVYTGFRLGLGGCYGLNDSPTDYTDIRRCSFLVGSSGAPAAGAPAAGAPAAGAPAAGAATPTCDGGNGTPTALGCIPNQPAEAIKLILPWAIGLGTGLAFLLFLYGAFTLITAGPDPQKVDTGKSIITSAAAGLIFIILALALLRIIGVDILKL